MTNQTTTIPTVRILRRRWKPHKERLIEQGGEQATSIRFHRACSWIARVEKNEDVADNDSDLISLWIAFNALYGQWDEQKREPKPDRASWRSFSDSVLKLDQTGYVQEMLTEHKRLVMSLLEDEHLSSFFWQEPTEKQARKSKSTMYDARSWYIEKRWTMIMDRLLERVYLMRCQLVHGAATHGSKLNRISLRRCTMMMQRLLPACLMVWIDHGADENWGQMCYPPLPAVQQSEKKDGRLRRHPR